MSDKLLTWIENHKNDDGALVQFIRLGYSIGQKSYVHTTISALLGILAPILYEKGKMMLFILFLILIILDGIYAYICNAYSKEAYKKRKFAHEILSNQSSLLKSITVEIENNNNWKSKIFKTVADLVCEKIYQNFKEIFRCDTRVSVEYVFNKNFKNVKSEKHIKMVSRRSGKRSTVRKSVELEKKRKYYAYKIFLNEEDGVNILDTTELNDKDIWYKNPMHTTDVKTYIGIAVKAYDKNDLKFILQIDFLDTFAINGHNSKADIRNFVENYLTPYINLIHVSYLLNLNNKKEIPEV